jgi:hypothetical protein
MNLKKLATFEVLVLSLIMLGEVNAAGISVRCGVTGVSRSNTTVVGSGLRGRYYAIVASGGHAFKSPVKASNIKGVVVFSFDSYPTIIAAGATRIPAAFIQDLRVEGYIRQDITHRLVSAIAANCVAR